MKTIGLFSLIIFVFLNTKAQELFVVTEPASNVPAGSLSIGSTQQLLYHELLDKQILHFTPKIDYGVNKNLMLRLQAFFNNLDSEFNAKGASIYTKYRFYSEDEIHNHLRASAFGRISYNKGEVLHESLNLQAENSGYEIGLVATKLIKKTAISTSISYLEAINFSNDNRFPTEFGKNFTNYTLSIGRLIHPKVYTNFKQTNINIMAEFLGQYSYDNGKNFIDFVPSIQFIFNSQYRLDIAYRQEITGSFDRVSTNGILINFNYIFFNL